MIKKTGSIKEVKNEGQEALENIALSKQFKTLNESSMVDIVEAELA